MIDRVKIREFLNRIFRLLRARRREEARQVIREFQVWLREQIEFYRQSGEEDFEAERQRHREKVDQWRQRRGQPPIPYEFRERPELPAGSLLAELIAEPEEERLLPKAEVTKEALRRTRPSPLPPSVPPIEIPPMVGERPGLVICPGCGASLRVQAPSRFAMVAQVVTTLKCPLCGAPAIEVPTAGYKIEAV